jgi:hypothetical protein
MLAAFLAQSKGPPSEAKAAPDADALKRTRVEADALTQMAKDGFSEFKTSGLSIFAVLEDMASTNNTSSLSLLSKEACLGLRQFVQGVRAFERRRTMPPALPPAAVELAEERLLKWRDTSMEILEQLREELEGTPWMEPSQARTAPGIMSRRGIEVFEDQLYILGKIGGPDWVFLYAESPSALRRARGEEAAEGEEGYGMDEDDEDQWSEDSTDSEMEEDQWSEDSTDSELEAVSGGDADAAVTAAAIEELSELPEEHAILEIDAMASFLTETMDFAAPLKVAPLKVKKLKPAKPAKPTKKGKKVKTKKEKTPKKPAIGKSFKAAAWAVRASNRADVAKAGIKDIIRMERDEAVRRSQVARRESVQSIDCIEDVFLASIGPVSPLNGRRGSGNLAGALRRTKQREHHEEALAAVAGRGLVKERLYAAAQRAKADAALSGQYPGPGSGASSSSRRRTKRSSTMPPPTRSERSGVDAACSRGSATRSTLSLPLMKENNSKTTRRRVFSSPVSRDVLRLQLCHTRSIAASDMRAGRRRSSTGVAAEASAERRRRMSLLQSIRAAAPVLPTLLDSPKEVKASAFTSAAASIAPKIAPLVVTHSPLSSALAGEAAALPVVMPLPTLIVAARPHARATSPAIAPVVAPVIVTHDATAAAPDAERGRAPTQEELDDV